MRQKTGRISEPLLLRIALRPKKPASPESGPEASCGPEDDPPLLCARCAAVVTYQGHAIQMHDRHVHAFFNPAGIAFQLRCFQKAPGAAPWGEPSTEFTWFPGFRWQTAFCTTCQAHLGWLFSNDSSFFGLISTSLL